MLLEEGLRAFNNALKTVNVRSMNEVDNANEQINRRGEEIKEIDNVMKNLIGKILRLEDWMHALEEEGLE